MLVRKFSQKRVLLVRFGAQRSVCSPSALLVAHTVRLCVFGVCCGNALASFGLLQKFSMLTYTKPFLCFYKIAPLLDVRTPDTSTPPRRSGFPLFLIHIAALYIALFHLLESAYQAVCTFKQNSRSVWIFLCGSLGSTVSRIFSEDSPADRSHTVLSLLVAIIPSKLHVRLSKK